MRIRRICNLKKHTIPRKETFSLIQMFRIWSQKHPLEKILRNPRILLELLTKLASHIPQVTVHQIPKIIITKEEEMTIMIIQKQTLKHIKMSNSNNRIQESKPQMAIEASN